MQRRVLGSPFGGGRTPPFLALVAENGVTINTMESPPDPPESLVGTLDPSITPAIAAEDAAIIATDSRSPIVRFLSGLTNAITVAGEVVRAMRGIPPTAAASWHRATGS